MDGLAATKRIRELEQRDEAILITTLIPEQLSSSEMDIPARRIKRIPIVGLSADIQHSTKEVTYQRLVQKNHERCAAFFLIFFNIFIFYLATCNRNASRPGWMNTRPNLC